LPSPNRRFFALIALCLGLAAPMNLVAQDAEPSQESDPQVVVGIADERWERSLGDVERELGRADTTDDSATRFLEQTAEVRVAAEAAVSELQPRVDSLQRRLDALGPAPEEGAAPEAPEVAAQRATLNQELQKLNAQISQAKLAIVRADELDRQIGTLSQRRRFEALLHSYPFPWVPGTWEEAVPEFGNVVELIVSSPADWWQEASRDQRHSSLSQRAAGLLVFALLVGGFLRHWLLRRYGRDPASADPSYTTRLLAAIASAVARGIVPALVFGGLIYMAWSYRAEEASLFWSLLLVFFAVMVFFSLAWALPYAVLSPDLPQWRLLPISPENARRLGWRFTLLATLFALDIFMSEAHQVIGVGDAYHSLATFLLNALPALMLIETSRQRYWHVVEQASDEAEAEDDDKSDAARESMFWRVVRRLFSLAAAISIIAALLGYADLGDFVITNLLLSLLTMGGLAILRGLTRELIGASLRSDFMREALEIRHVARSQIKFWLRLLLDAALLVFGTIMIAAIWVSPFGGFWAETRRLISGVTIGGVTISLSDLLVALVVFALILLLTRVGQRFLGNRLLPRTGFDTGVQNSLSAGFGYLGVILAAVFGISALGIDLSNIALIAGALSVGIGFGLQTIVSNFVSGIILLIERPVKVGDWVVVGGNEGTVKRITVRSTELTTFQRASVIIPNSDFVSTAVTNWTHKDHYGRIEVAVGVAYGSDVEKVREVLLDCAQKHERVLTSPEPHVIFMNFGASSLDFELRCYTAEVSYRLLISSDLRFAIDKAFREAGIEIPFPQSVIHFADQQEILERLDSRNKGNPPQPID
jgi:small-conductance mechanosensitive channel